MLKLIFVIIYSFIVTVNCDNLRVNTASGPIVGVLQRTFVNQVPYISYKGIPYAQPPVGNLRFRAPRAVTPWKKPLVTTDNYQYSCIVVAQGKHIPLDGRKQNENCLFLNIYTPVMDDVKVNKRLPVIFNVPGGGFNDGDGTDGYYGPDFILEQNAILVNLNYRLGPFGFANFDLENYTGNMGLKDQREALKWVKKNIKYFGGDPQSLTIFGESSGAASVHYQILSNSCEYINRAIMWSGSAFNYWAHHKQNNQLNLLRETFKAELGNRTSPKEILNFMINATTQLIIEKIPVFDFSNGLIEVNWTPVIEDKTKSDQPILIENPHNIYANNRFSFHCKNVEVVFGTTSAEYMMFLDPTNLYGWVEQMKTNRLIGLPYHGLTLTPNDQRYKAMQTKIKQFYFGDGEIEATPKRLNQYVQMNSDINFVVPFYEVMSLHSKVSKTFCHHFDINLNTNIIKKPRHLEMVERMGHLEDIGYMYKANQFKYMYEQSWKNRSDATNNKTIEAWQFVTKLFIDFAKSGTLANSSPVKSVKNAQCVDITNDGLRSIIRPKKESMTMWDNVREYLKPFIVDEY
ncbi:juvenile hormone esterase-like [Contarinia nasturtii]|uniref:juvenile hormone esterase-like n=1 Tax=Contarinia nasturtii TaxID=265458 RepID=UPI0012D3BB5A|nr:juvenile hormone esterase-like [Contarinia nasturtii]